MHSLYWLLNLLKIMPKLFIWVYHANLATSGLIFDYSFPNLLVLSNRGLIAVS